jgi:hypothetical protein
MKNRYTSCFFARESSRIIPKIRQKMAKKSKKYSDTPSEFRLQVANIESFRTLQNPFLASPPAICPPPSRLLPKRNLL